MQQLITIETVPISIKYSGAQASLAVDESAQKPQHTAESREAAEVRPMKPVRVRTDSFVRSTSAGVYNLTYTATAQFADNGSLRLNAEISNTGSQAFHRFGRDIQNIMNRIFGDRQDSSYEFESMQLNFDLDQLPDAPGSGETGRVFTPPDLEIEIMERPKVIIKYVGGPIYIPRSANPDYEAPDGIDAKV